MYYHLDTLEMMKAKKIDLIKLHHTNHTREYQIVDEEYAYLAPAKAMALTVVDLLFDNAEKGKEILKNFTPIMTKEEYLKFMDSNDKVIKA